MNTLENIVYTVNDLNAAKAIQIALLDTEPHTDNIHYVGFNVGGTEIGLTPVQRDAATSTVAHIRVADLDATLERARKAGATVVNEPRQVSPGTRVAAVQGSEGPVYGLIEHTEATA
ncbi:VOC family protein [Nocardia aobensis]|uniref:VOC family protein n=1 Tax=Nocardia aobensis TaxID=257277 RepID=UPI00030BFEE7|nr:VOC family protein [Nocardia aobensis]